MIYRESFRAGDTLGWVVIIAHEGALVSVDFAEEPKEADRPSPLTGKARQQLQEYLEGRRREFDLPLDPRGTRFQQEVWQALGTVPYGETISYGELARRAGRTGAFRAVGQAVGKNPISILIPCHRIIGKDGSLTGFGGGLSRKVCLLDLERKSPDMIK